MNNTGGWSSAHRTGIICSWLNVNQHDQPESSASVWAKKQLLSGILPCVGVYDSFIVQRHVLVYMYIKMRPLSLSCPIVECITVLTMQASDVHV